MAHVTVGKRVEKGQAVVVLESIETKTVLRAPRDGVVKAIGVPRARVRCQ